MAALAAIFMTFAARAGVGERPWSVTAYIGPASTKYFGAFIQKLNLEPTSVMFGVALDRKLAYLGADISLAGEIQFTQYFFGHYNTTGALEFGLQFEKLFGFDRTSFSAYTGPSYATDPPYTAIGYHNRLEGPPRKNFLNAVSLELAFGLPGSERWDAAVRMYHRSGVFGLYSTGNDAGIAFGLGVRYHF
jgi:hypothetical protein